MDVKLKPYALNGYLVIKEEDVQDIINDMNNLHGESDSDDDCMACELASNVEMCGDSLTYLIGMGRHNAEMIQQYGEIL